MNLKSIIESSYEDRVCECNNISRGELLKQSSFNQALTAKEVIESLVKKGCGCCLKNKDDWENSSCREKKELVIHYSDIIR